MSVYKNVGPPTDASEPEPIEPVDGPSAYGPDAYLINNGVVSSCDDLSQSTPLSPDASLLSPRPDGARTTILMAAFEGWNDAGEAASDALTYLAQKFGARQVGTIDPEEYYDFQFTRPSIKRDGEGKEKITWPITTVSHARLETHPLDIVFIHGIEPSYKWRSYIEELQEYVRGFGPDYVIMLGALLADVPHTRPIPITVTSENRRIQQLFGIGRSEYEGTVGIVGVLAQSMAHNDIPTISLWAAVPHYVAQAPNPKAKLSLITHLEDLCGITLSSTQLAEEAAAWEDEANELISDDPDITTYVAELEKAKDAVDLSGTTGESLAREFERYLKQNDKTL